MTSYKTQYWGSHLQIKISYNSISKSLLLYWGHNPQPTITLVGAREAHKTEEHMQVLLEEERGSISIDDRSVSWLVSSEGGGIEILDLEGRSLQVSEQGDFTEETFTLSEKERVDKEVKRVTALKRANKMKKLLITLFLGLGFAWMVRKIGGAVE